MRWVCHRSGSVWQPGTWASSARNILHHEYGGRCAAQRSITKKCSNGKARPRQVHLVLMASSRGYSELVADQLWCRRRAEITPGKKLISGVSGQMQGLVRRKGYGTNRCSVMASTRGGTTTSESAQRGGRCAGESDLEIDELRAVSDSICSRRRSSMSVGREVELRPRPWHEQRSLRSADHGGSPRADIASSDRSPPRLRSAARSAAGERSSASTHRAANSHAIGRRAEFSDSGSAPQSRPRADESYGATSRIDFRLTMCAERSRCSSDL